jgi:hypothetical protein
MPKGLLYLPTTTEEISKFDFLLHDLGACRASGLGFGASLSAAVVENCSRLYADRGYVRIEKLTLGLRASVERRGLLR